MGTVNVIGGQVDVLLLTHMGSANVSGGSVGDIDAKGGAAGPVNISGGSVGSIEATAAGGGPVHISGGSVGSATINHGSDISGGSVGRIDNFGTVNVSGGQVVSIYTDYGGTANVSGGQVDSISDFLGTENVSGGQVGSITEYGGAVNFSGGQVGSIYTELLPLLEGTLFFNTADALSWNLSSGLSLSGNQVLGSGVLSGVWDDGTAFSTNVNGGAAPVPEPLTMVSAFLAMGALGGYVRRRLRRAPAEIA